MHDVTAKKKIAAGWVEAVDPASVQAPDPGTNDAPNVLPTPAEGKVLIYIPEAAHRRGTKCHDKETGLCEASLNVANTRVEAGTGTLVDLTELEPGVNVDTELMDG